MRPEACCRVGKSIVVCLLGCVESQSESSDHENTVNRSASLWYFLNKTQQLVLDLRTQKELGPFRISFLQDGCDKKKKKQNPE